MAKKGGSTTQTTEVQLPPEIEEAARQNLNIANSVASLGNTPFNAPSIAGFAPQQMMAMQSADQAASAFGMPSAVNWQQGAGGQMRAPQGISNDRLFTALTGMPPPNSRMAGFQGYNTQPIAQGAYNQLGPAQRALIESFTMNPVTGAAPANVSVPTPQHSIMVNRGQGRTPAEREAIARANAAKARAKANAKAATSNKPVTPVRRPLTREEEIRYEGGNR